MAIQLKASVHDQTQVELDLDYQIHEGPPPAIGAKTWSVNFYFFIPHSLGIHPSTYTREQFYNDLTNHMRLHTPNPGGSALELLKPVAEYLSVYTPTRKKTDLVALVCQQVKLFANRINASLKQIQQTLSNELHSPSFPSSHSTPSSFQHRRALDLYIQSIKDLIQDIEVFRSQYVEPVRHPRLTVVPEVQKVILSADEFIKNRFEATFSRLLHRCRTSDQPHLNELRILFREILSSQAQYQLTQCVPQTESKHTPNQEREVFYYRHGLLKKFISMPLYLQKKSSKQERVYRNWIAAFGAALAGIWAQIADLQARRMAAQQDLGFSFFGIAGLAIMAYVFKDRIKDLTKEYFNEKMKTYLPDYKVKLIHTLVTEDLQTKHILIGRFNEFMRYLDIQSTPQEIQYIRKMHERKDLQSEHLEGVIHYNKKLRINTHNLKLEFKGVSSIKDIIRFNFSDFLDHLDDHEKSLATFDEDEGTGEVITPKVYHINLLIHSICEPLNRFAHYRVILDKRGIVRVEELNQPDLLQYYSTEK